MKHSYRPCMMPSVPWGGDEMLVEASAVIILALLIDLVLSDPPNRLHPLRWMGNLVDTLERRISRKGVWNDRIMGMLSYILVATIALVSVLLVTALLREYVGIWAWVIASAFLFKITFAVSSFRRHCSPIQRALEEGDLESARSMTQMIVSRDVSCLGPDHVSSCCVETVAENSVDSVVSPALYMGVFGLAGAYAFRCANLMDAMWGYRKEKFANLGTFPARLDDVLGFMTSRLSIPFLALAALLLRMDVSGLFRVSSRDHSLTPSPNSGWPMAAAAGALGITMEKPAGYRIGDGPLPTVIDIERSLRLVELTSVIFLLAVTLPLYATLGVQVQMHLEDTILGIIGGLL